MYKIRGADGKEYGPANAEQMDHALEALRRGPMSEGELVWMRRVGAAIHGK